MFYKPEYNSSEIQKIMNVKKKKKKKNKDFKNLDQAAEGNTTIFFYFRPYHTALHRTINKINWSFSLGLVFFPIANTPEKYIAFVITTYQEYSNFRVLF